MKIVIEINVEHITRPELHDALAHATYGLPDDRPEQRLVVGMTRQVYRDDSVIGTLRVVA